MLKWLNFLKTWSIKVTSINVLLANIKPFNKKSDDYNNNSNKIALIDILLLLFVI
jgi:hypothetical protein